MENTLTSALNQTVYAGVALRVKALCVDTLVLIIMMMVFSALFSAFEYVPDGLRIAAMVFIFLLYDPLFTSFSGATLGQRLFGLRVRKETDTTQKIIFPLALIRFLVKATLGWISLLTVQASAQRKAIHDLLVGSVVVEVRLN